MKTPGSTLINVMINLEIMLFGNLLPIFLLFKIFNDLRPLLFKIIYYDWINFVFDFVKIN